MEEKELLKKALKICRETKNCERCELFNLCCYNDLTPYAVESFFKVLREHITKE